MDKNNLDERLKHRIRMFFVEAENLRQGNAYPKVFPPFPNLVKIHRIMSDIWAEKTRFHQTLADLGAYVERGAIDADDCDEICRILLSFLNDCAIDIYHVA